MKSRIFSFTSLLFCLANFGCSTDPIGSAKLNSELPPSKCSFVGGFDSGRSKFPYLNSCAGPAEEDFLIGYRMGRKTAWVDETIEIETHNLQCLQKENELKFVGTFSPIHFDTDSSDSRLHQELTGLDCPSIFLRTTFEMAQAIADARASRDELIIKYSRILNLREAIAKDTSKANGLIRDYEAQGPVDTLDINLNWKDFIKKKGGLQNLEDSTKQLLYQEIPKLPTFPNELLAAGIIGFGFGHYKQGRFLSDGWKYALLDSVLLASLISGFNHHDDVIFNQVLGIIGIPISRGFQILDLHTYNLDSHVDIENLRTMASPARPQFQANWNW